jgi:hypothetical protein
LRLEVHYTRPEDPPPASPDSRRDTAQSCGETRCVTAETHRLGLRPQRRHGSSRSPARSTRHRRVADRPHVWEVRRSAAVSRIPPQTNSCPRFQGSLAYAQMWHADCPVVDIIMDKEHADETHPSLRVRILCTAVRSYADRYDRRTSANVNTWFSHARGRILLQLAMAGLRGDARWTSRIHSAPAERKLGLRHT